MKNPPTHLNLRQISETFGVAMTDDARVILVQLEDGKGTDLVETNSWELYQAYLLVRDALIRTQEIMKEAQLTKPN